MKKVLVFGGTGLVGSKLTKLLAQEYTVQIVSRNPNPDADIQEIYYAPDNNKYPIEEICNAHKIVFLQGAGVADKTWTDERKQLIVNSRVEPILAVKEILRTYPNQLEQIVSASAIGIYGNRGSELVDESTQVQSRSFLEQSVIDWENAIFTDETYQITAVRIGLVFSLDGGALPQLLQPLRFGISPYFIPGNDWYSWIHITDLVRVFQHLMQKNLGGVYNAVADNPVTTKELARTLISAKGFGISFPAPRWLAGIVLGERKQLILDSVRISNQKLQDSGFQCNFQKLLPTLQNLLSK